MRARRVGRPDGNPDGQGTPQTRTDIQEQEDSARSVPERQENDKCAATKVQTTAILPFAVYTLAEAAALLHVSERRVRDLAAAGDLPRLRHTRNFVVWGEDIIDYLRSVSVASEPRP